MTFQQRLNAAFRAMRKAGLMARQKFSCCGSCGGYDLATEITAMPPGKRAKVTGCAFYTKQAAERMYDRRGEAQGVIVQYGQVHTEAHGPVGLSTSACGDIVATCLKEAGLAVEWDGSPDKTIYATPK